MLHWGHGWCVVWWTGILGVVTLGSVVVLLVSIEVLT